MAAPYPVEISRLEVFRRNQAHASLRELGRALECSAQYLSQVERGRRPMSARLQQLVFARFGVWLAMGLVLLVGVARAEASLVLVVCTAERCVAASDSRAWRYDTAKGELTPTTRTSFRDDSIKIAFRGRFILAATNHTGQEPSGGLGVWAAWRAVGPVAAETAERYVKRLVPALARFLVPAPGRMSAALGVFGYSPRPDAPGRIGAVQVRTRAAGAPRTQGAGGRDHAGTRGRTVQGASRGSEYSQDA